MCLLLYLSYETAGVQFGWFVFLQRCVLAYNQSVGMVCKTLVDQRVAWRPVLK